MVSGNEGQIKGVKIQIGGACLPTFSYIRHFGDRSIRLVIYKAENLAILT